MSYAPNSCWVTFAPLSPRHSGCRNPQQKPGICDQFQGCMGEQNEGRMATPNHQTQIALHWWAKQVKWWIQCWVAIVRSFKCLRTKGGLNQEELAAARGNNSLSGLTQLKFNLCHFYEAYIVTIYWFFILGKFGGGRCLFELIVKWREWILWIRLDRTFLQCKPRHWEAGIVSSPWQ